MERSYYEMYYHLERNHWWFVVRSSLIKQCLGIHLPLKQNLKILNVGIATGATSKMLESFGKVISSEYDSETCTFLREKLNMEVIQASITDLPFQDDSFDLVCAFDVIEHVEDDNKAMQELKRVCRKNGFISITVPANMALWSQHDVINHHFRRYQLRDIETMAESLGLRAVYRSYFNSLLYLPVFLARKLKNFIGDQSKPSSDFEIQMPNWINTILKKLFSIEKLWFGRKKVSFGVSIFWLGKKNDEPGSGFII